MPDVYAYVSQSKVAQLADQSPAFLARITAKLDFKLPFVSAGISAEKTSSTLSDLKKLIPKLHSAYDIRSYSDLSEADTPVFVSFRGQAARHTEGEAFFLAMESEHVGLLLAGSAGFALGGGGSVPGRISPSAAPVDAFLRVSSEQDAGGKSVLSRLNYVWEQLMQDSWTSGMTLPQFEGIAVFAARLREPKEYATRRKINSLVVGTPLYVKQVPSPSIRVPRRRLVGD